MIRILIFLICLFLLNCAANKKLNTEDKKVSSIPLANASVESIKTIQEEVVLNPIYFEFDSYFITDNSIEILSKTSQILVSNKDLKITIEGNCDERGSAEYNMALGQKRADEVKKYFVSCGINIDRIQTMSWGEEKPAVEGQNEEAWSKNRRDEFKKQ